MHETNTTTHDQAPQQQISMASEGGASMSPPGFALQASPMQLQKGGSQAVIQAKKPDLTPEQQRLKDKFIMYRDTKIQLLNNKPGEQKKFKKRASSFIKDMDDNCFFEWFSSTDYWGDGDYDGYLRDEFKDFDSVMAGKRIGLRGEALAQSEAAELAAQKTVQLAQQAVKSAGENLETAEKAAQTAELKAVEAEKAAADAETASKTDGADEMDKAAAVKARTAATEARKAADLAKAAVLKAKGAKEVIGDQLKMAQGQLEMAQDRVQTAKTSNDVLVLESIPDGGKLKDGANSLGKAIASPANLGQHSAESATQHAEDSQTHAATAAREKENATPIAGLKDNFEAIDAAKDEKARKKAGVDLINLARELTGKYPEMLMDYKGQATPDATEKMRVIGELIAISARIEWLAGTIYLGGSGKKDKWEVGSSNRDKDDVLSSYYQEETGSGEGTGPWCTRFSMTVRKNAVGMRGKNGHVSGNAWSGYKVGRADYWDYEEAQGGKHAGKGVGQGDEKAFVDLHKAIKKEKEADARKTIVESFFKDHIKPQAGDVMVVKRSEAKANSYYDGAKSHTTTIEKVEGSKIYTIEGNSGGRVMGKVYDLTDKADTEKIIFISRVSLNSIGFETEKQKKAREKKEGGGKQVAAGPEKVLGDAGATPLVEEDILGPAKRLEAKLRAYAEKKKYVDTLAEGEVDSVYHLQQSTSGKSMD